MAVDATISARSEPLRVLRLLRLERRGFLRRLDRLHQLWVILSMQALHLRPEFRLKP